VSKHAGFSGSFSLILYCLVFYEEVTMTAEIACPKCGDNNIQKKVWTIYRRSGKRVWGTRPGLLVIGGLSLLIYLMLVIAVFVNGEQWYMIPVGFLYFGSFPTYLLIDYFVSEKIKLNNYKCLKCGDKWSERVENEGNIIHCVNCGSINTLSKKVVVDKNTNKKINGFLYAGLGGVLALAGFSMIVLTLASWGFMTCQGLATGLAALSGGIPMIIRYFTGKKVLKNSCLDCGHTWDEVQSDTSISS
jgi:DNA-directed RNA polymerase subunit RPC12/RpoP